MNPQNPTIIFNLQQITYCIDYKIICQELYLSFRVYLLTVGSDASLFHLLIGQFAIAITTFAGMKQPHNPQSLELCAKFSQLLQIAYLALP